MSSNLLTVRLLGELPPLDGLTLALGVSPTVVGRRGTPLHPGFKTTFEQDVWTLQLADWEGPQAPLGELMRAAEDLERMAPTLSGLDRSKVDAQLGIQVIQFERNGEAYIPSEIVAAAGRARLRIHVDVVAELNNETAKRLGIEPMS